MRGLARVLGWAALSLVLGPRGSVAGGETRLFVGDDVYFVIWELEPESGRARNAFHAPAPEGGAVSHVGPLARAAGLAYDGRELFYTRGTTRRLWVMDPDTGRVLRAFDKPSVELSGLAADGERLFAVAPFARGGPISELDPLTGALVRTIDIPRAREGLTYAHPRGSLFVPVGALEVREIDRLGETLGSFVPPVPFTGLGYSGARGVLFAVDGAGSIYSLNPDTGVVESQFHALDFTGKPVPPASSLAADEAAAAPQDPDPLDPAEPAGPIDGDGGGGDPGGGGTGTAPAELIFEAQDTVGRVGEDIDVPILLTASEPAEGFVVALLHAQAVLSLNEMTVDGTATAMNGADFFSGEIFVNGGTTGVIMDLLPPFDDNTLPAATDLPIVRYLYSCVQVDIDEDVETELRFVDGVLGSPSKTNVVVIGGRSYPPELRSGRVFCRPLEPVEGGPEFICGGPLGPDGQPEPLAAGRGEEVTLCFYYIFPDTQGNLFQGLSMALAFDCRLQCVDGSFRTPPESVTEQVDADFVQFDCDDNPDDGDGCEMVLGVLVDTLPPFEGGSLPESEEPALVGCVDLAIGPGVETGECLEVRFRDGVKGTGAVPIKNLVVVENQPFPVVLTSCNVCVTSSLPSFLCGGAALGPDNRPEPVVGEPGAEVDVCLWYRSPADDPVALTQAIRFDCNLECLEETFMIDPEMPELLDAELVRFDCDNDAGDGDGCEMVLEIVYASGGAGGEALPATNRPRRLGCVTMRISEDAPRGRCNVLEYLDGVDGTGTEPVSNRIEFATGPVSPDVFDCLVCVPALRPKFYCGGLTLGEDGLPGPVRAVPRGARTEVCFWYESPVDELTSKDEIQGLSMSILFDCGLECDESSFRFPPGSIVEDVMPEFVQFHCDNDPADGDGCEMVLGLVVDAFPPFDGRTLPPSDTPLLVACVDMIAGTELKLGFCLPVQFVDGLNGRFLVPVKNLVSIHNEAMEPETCDCEVCIEPLGPKFLCGGAVLGPNNLPVPVEAPASGLAELCFWYCAPEDDEPGHEQLDHLQGVSMALTFDCRLTCIEESFRVPEDSITHALEAEFVTFHCDNDPADGDGCEMVVGILLDALPPFDGRTLPPTSVPLKLACVDLRVPEDAECGTCFPITFENGINGSGKVPVFNLISTENMSFLAITHDCEVCIVPVPVFQRGNCNFEGMVDVSDAAMVVSTLFGQGTWKPLPPCVDACDANDDGRLDLADAFAILHFVFNVSARELPAPGPMTFGTDPTPDKLDCDVNPCP
jgi:hypothetical protein